MEEFAMSKKNPLLPELLIPAGGKEQFEAACIYGADAVYLGGEGLNLRKSSHSFTHEELKTAVKEAHKVNVEVFYCLNAFPFDNQMQDVKSCLTSLANTEKEEQVDALIIADAGIFSLAREICPQIPIHLSTQAHTVNAESIKFWQKQGATRVNLARESSFENIKSLVEALPDMECEVFMHGAMCLALSGHCLLSMWSNNRVANLGACSQPCRFEYKGKELRINDHKIDELALAVSNPNYKEDIMWEVEENDEFSTIWAPHEQCLIRYISYLKQLKVASLKIEGRTKSPSYVAQVTDIYRTAIDRTLLTQKEKQALPYSYKDLIRELASVATRPLSTGFFLPERKIEAMPLKVDKKIVGRILEEVKEGSWLVDVRATWKNNKELQVLVPGYKRPQVMQYSLENHKGEKVDVLHPGMKGIIHCGCEDLSPKLYLQTIN